MVEMGRPRAARGSGDQPHLQLVLRVKRRSKHGPLDMVWT